MTRSPLGAGPAPLQREADDAASERLRAALAALLPEDIVVVVDHTADIVLLTFDAPGGALSDFVHGQRLASFPEPQERQ